MYIDRELLFSTLFSLTMPRAPDFGSCNASKKGISSFYFLALNIGYIWKVWEPRIFVSDRAIDTKHFYDFEFQFACNNKSLDS